MEYEIEFFPVGDASKAGDAIMVRYGRDGDYRVIIIDGGTGDTGQKIVEHIRNTFGENTVVNDVISTHPDSDHASGLRKVLEELPVERLWIHGLWKHSAEMLPYFDDGRWTEEGLTKAILAEYPIIAELIELADDTGTEVLEPFAGEQIGPFKVLSPTKWAYLRLVPQFRKTPAPNQDLLKQENMWLGEVLKQSIFAKITEAVAAKVAEWIDESWSVELLKEGGVTAAENETSTVLWGDFGSSKVLLTADAGINALWWSCDYAEQCSISIQSAELVQVPHHGSRRNVSPTVLDRILGPKTAPGTPETKKAIVSAPKDDSSHPRKMVMNAFRRRGAGVRSTQGVKYRFYNGMPARKGEKIAEPFSFFAKVEAYD